MSVPILKFVGLLMLLPMWKRSDFFGVNFENVPCETDGLCFVLIRRKEYHSGRKAFSFVVVDGSGSMLQYKKLFL